MNRLAALALALAALASSAAAEPTRVVVRAHSLDAKFIGTSMGGVDVTLTDASGKVLAKGLTSGDTGNTETLVRNPHARGAPLADGASAAFTATLDLAKPTLVTATARGPMGKPASAITVSSSLWVLPGREVGGDGWILSFPGLVVEPTAAATPGGLQVTAKVSPMCGCPIEPGGLWDAANYAVEARLLSGDRVVAKAPLAYAGTV
ncbi:MAG: hypothetical protein BGN86_11470, partial [Caulobacterales bacterium 68-7]